MEKIPTVASDRSSIFRAFEKGFGVDGDPEAIVAINPDLHNQVDQMNGWLEENEVSIDAANFAIKVASRGFEAMLRWIWGPLKSDLIRKRHRVLDENGMRQAMRRAVVVCWLMRPELLVDANGKQMSLRQIAKLPWIDCSFCRLTELGNEFSKIFNFHSRIQKRETTKGNKGKSAASAKIGWQKRKRREALKKKNLNRLIDEAQLKAKNNKPLRKSSKGKAGQGRSKS